MVGNRLGSGASPAFHVHACLTTASCAACPAAVTPRAARSVSQEQLLALRTTVAAWPSEVLFPKVLPATAACHLNFEEFAFELRTRDRERKLTNKIAVSIEKIKQDDYGWCDSCGDEIGVKRLEARPTATHCIHCKTLDEIKERQLGG